MSKHPLRPLFWRESGAGPDERSFCTTQSHTGHGRENGSSCTFVSCMWLKRGIRNTNERLLGLWFTVTSFQCSESSQCVCSLCNPTNSLPQARLDLRQLGRQTLEASIWLCAHTLTHNLSRSVRVGSFRERRKKRQGRTAGTDPSMRFVNSIYPPSDLPSGNKSIQHTNITQSHLHSSCHFPLRPT